MAEEKGEARQKLLRALKQIGPLRLVGTAVFLLLGLACARYSWQLPLAGDAERALYDLRFATDMERVDQDPRIVLVTYNDDTLALLGKRSPLDRRMLADALTAIDGMGAKAIGIDILIDQPQPEDDRLVESFRALKTPTFLAFASSAANPDQMLYWQEDFLRRFLARIRTPAVHAASIKLEPDKADGVIRRWPRPDSKLPPLLATALSPAHPEFRRYAGSIDFRASREADSPVFMELPIQLFAQMPEALSESVRGRYVLIGGNINDLDDFETPMSRATGRWTKGIEVHAQLLAQLLDGRKRASMPHWALWLAAIAVVVAAALTSLLEIRSWKLPAAVGAQILVFAALPFLLQAGGGDTYGLPAFGWGVGWIFAFAALSAAARGVGSEQRRFAQATLGKYLPADVAAEILKDPTKLTLRGEKRPIYALFSDLESFTELSHAISAEQLSILLNRYLDVLSETVLHHGGTIDKFVGDAIVAFWGAPLAREDDGDRAVLAAVALYEAGERFRREAVKGLPPIGCTRVGLNYGDAVVGNFGGEGRIQYTALGDGMNTASRLESANKSLKTRVLVSREAKERSSLDIFRPMGRIVLIGRATPVEVWEPVPDAPLAQRKRLAELWRRFDGGDSAALDELTEFVADKSDAALDNFVYRLRHAGPGGAFVLASK